MKRLFLMLGLILASSGIAQAGTLTGKITFTGTAPQMEPIKMTADPYCAAAHKEAVIPEDVVVNSNSTLKNVFVYVKQGLEGKTFEAPKEVVSMDQNGCHYVPHVFGIQVGQPFEIINSDATLHNVHAMPTDSKQFNVGMPIKGMKIKKSFDAPEVMVKIKCDVHPWMHAYVGVLNHPFYSVSNDQGTFEIKDLPAGKYTIEAWHEKYGTQTQEITVGDGSQEVNFDFKSDTK